MQKKDGFFNLEKDKEAVKEFMREVKKKSIYFDSLEKRIKYMIENDYYYNVLEQYTMNQIYDIDRLVKSYNFQFASYMAATKFYSDYALTTNNDEKFLEFYEDRIVICALYLAQGNYEKAKNFAIAMIEQLLQPSTPTYLNAGKSRRGEMVSCFLLDMDDSLNSINHVLGMCMQLSKIGGGVAVNLSKLRGRGEPIKGVEKAAKGIIPVLKLMEDAFSYADQMGQRKGSGAGYYNIFGWDVLEFLDSKKINADEKIRLKTLSIGLIIPQKFYELAEQNKSHVVFAPYSVFKAYGIHLDDMNIDEMYDQLLANDRVKKQTIMSARDMLTKIATIQLESGYPYIMNRTNANKNHPLKDIGIIRMSNLCTEIFQLQETSDINDYEVPDKIRRDISCNLASINIVNTMNPNKPEKLRFAVHTGMDVLTQVSDMTSVSNAPSVKIANEELHSVGLGAMNLHGFLVKSRIPYESEEAKDFVRTYFMMLNYYSIEKSMLIAKERNVKFKDFEKSEYAKGTYFNTYLQEDFSPKTEKVKKLFEGFSIPNKKDWAKLATLVKEHGLYHAYRLAVAPTQSISYVQNSTSSIMPIVEQIENRVYGDSTTYYPMPYLDQSNIFFYKSAYNMDMFKVIDLIAEAQRHVDQGISTVLFVNSNTSTRDLARYYIYANKRGLKSLYYTRTNRISVEECTSCAV
jgi:ribonucleoside-diphosphate reductase alpha chain